MSVLHLKNSVEVRHLLAGHPSVGGSTYLPPGLDGNDIDEAFVSSGDYPRSLISFPELVITPPQQNGRGLSSQALLAGSGRSVVHQQ